MTKATRVGLGVAVLLLGYAGAHRVAFRSMERQGWLNSWEYLTRKDRKIGFRLRPGISSLYSGLPVHVNEDGVRAPQRHGHVSGRANGELLILSAGDSNTFGVSIPYEKTYSSVLGQLLAERLKRPVRVINLGVPGHSLLQTTGLLAEWMDLHPDVVVVADSFNNRAFLGRADSESGFAWDYLSSRPYEFGGFISYPLLYLYRTYYVLPRTRSEPVPLLAHPMPIPRISSDAHRRLVRKLSELTASVRAALILLVAGEGEPVGAPPMEAGLVAYREGRCEDALAVFEAVRLLRPSWYLPSYYSFQSAICLGRPALATAIQRDFEAAYGRLTYRYLESFSRLSSESLPELREATAGGDVTIVDTRARLRERFVDVCHYDAEGHAIVADALASVLVEDPRLRTARAYR